MIDLPVQERSRTSGGRDGLEAALLNWLGRREQEDGYLSRYLQDYAGLAER